jgi:hypothetical protein
VPGQESCRLGWLNASESPTSLAQFRRSHVRRAAGLYLASLLQVGQLSEMTGLPDEALLAFKEAQDLVRALRTCCLAEPQHAFRAVQELADNDTSSGPRTWKVG